MKGDMEAMEVQTKRIIRAYLLLIVLLGGLGFLSLAVGSVRVSAADLLAALTAKEGTDMVRHFLFDIRLPRMLAALTLGGALSVSGFLLQTFSQIRSQDLSSSGSRPEQSLSYRSLWSCSSGRD